MPIAVLAVIGLVLFGFSRVLLAVSHNAATVVALVAAAGIVSIAAWVASRKRVTGGTLFSMVAAMAGIAMVAGGLAVVAAPLHAEEEGRSRAGSSSRSRRPRARRRRVSRPTPSRCRATKPFTIAFDNQDPAVPHNVVVFDGPDAEAPALVTGELITGPATAEYAVEPVPEGEYFFHCEVHPTTMVGTMTAAPGGGGGGGEGVDAWWQRTWRSTPTRSSCRRRRDHDHDRQPGRRHAAQHRDLRRRLARRGAVQGRARDRSGERELHVPPLPAGEYYFHCDVHPTCRARSWWPARAAAAASGGGPGRRR